MVSGHPGAQALSCHIPPLIGDTMITTMITVMRLLNTPLTVWHKTHGPVINDNLITAASQQSSLSASGDG